MSAARAYLPALLWAALLLAIGSIPDPPGPRTSLPLDKLVHLLLYGGLGALAARGWRQSRRPRAALLIGLGLLVGVADELNQARVPGRSMEAADWIMDAIGVSGAFALVARRDLRKHEQEQEE